MSYREKSRKELLAEIRSLKTSIKKDESAKNKAADRFKLVFEEAADAIVLIDLKGFITAVNRSFCKLLGYKSSQIISLKLRDLFDPADIKQKPIVLKDLKEGKTILMERVFNSSKGKKIITEVSYKKISDKEILGIVRDVTSRKQIQRQLIENEVKTKIFLEQIPAVVWTTDEKLFLNTYSSKGKPVKKLFGQKLETIFPGKARTYEPIAGHYKALKGTTSRIVHRENEKVFESVLEPLKDNESKIIGVIGCSFDITEKVKQEEALKQSEQLFRTIAENSEDVVFKIVFNESGYRYDYISPSVEKLTGYKPEDFYKNPFISYEMIVDEDKKRAVERPAGKPFECVSSKVENRLNCKKGGICYVETVNNYFFDADAKPSVIIGVTRNITDRKHTERALIESEDRFRKMAEATSEGIVIHENGVIQDVNTAFCKMLGYSRQELLGSSAIALVIDEYKDVLREAIISRKSESYEAVGLRKNGETFIGELEPREMTIDGRSIRIVAVRDISLRKKQEAALLESEERFRMLAENAVDVVYRFQVYPEKKYEYVSPSVYGLTGYTPEDFYNDPYLGYKIVHVDDREKTAPSESILKAGKNVHRLRENTTILRWVTKSGEVVWTETRNNPIYDDKGLVRYIEGISRNITERIKLEHELIESRETYKSLLESIPAGVIIIDTERIVYANPSAFQIFGFSEILSDFEGLSIFDFILPEYHSKIHAANQKVIRGEKFPFLEIKAKRLDGQIVDIETRSVMVKYKGINCIQVVFYDITYRKRIEMSVRESEERLRVISEVSLEGIVFTDASRNIVDCNDRFIELLNYPDINMVAGKPFEDIIGCGKKKAAEILEANEKPVESGITVNGLSLFAEFKSDTIPFNGQELTATVIKDITKRKAYETEIDRSRKTYKALIESSPDAILIYRDEIIIYVNPEAKRIFEVDDDQILGTNVFSLVPSRMRSFARKRREAAEKGEMLNFVEVTLESFKGTLRSLETKSIRVEYQGEPAIMVVMHDLAERKQLIQEKLRAQIAEETNFRLQEEIERHRRTQKKLELNQQYTRSIIESSLDMIIAADINGNITEFNKAAQATFGYSFEELSGKPFDILYADKNERNRVTNEINTTGHFKGEVLNRKKNGEVFVSYLTASAHINDAGMQIGNMGVSRDITKMKVAEEALKLSEERYRAIYNHVFVGIAIVSLNGQFMKVNRQLCNMLGYDEQELTRMNFVDVTYPEDIEISNRLKDNLASGGEQNFTLEKRYINKKGELVYAMLTSTIVKNEKGEPDYFLSVFQDVTGQRKVEEQVKIQASKLNAIFESSSHLIWTIDANSCLTSYNRNFQELVRAEHKTDAFTGMKVNIGRLISTQDVNSTWIKRYGEAFQGIPQHFESSHIDSSTGKITWREIYLNPIYDRNNKVVEVSGIGHDITEKKLSEERIRSSLREKEVLLKEVHHRVKNNLQVISSILNLQSSYVKDKNTLEMLRESQDRIKSMSFIHESLYAAKDFSKINFAEYITNLSKNLLHSYRVYGNQVSLDIKADTVFMNLDYAIPSGLIINELISNAFKYAFPGDRSGRVSINMRESGNIIYIIIEDNGVGLPANIDYRNTESLGLQLVCTLVDQLNGQISLDNENGTKFTIWFNKDQKII